MSRPPFGSHIALFGLTISWYSLLILIAVAIGIALSGREEKRLRLPPESILNFALLAIPLGIIGARLYYVAFTFETFRRDPLSILFVWNGGVAIYGAILGGLLAAWIVSRRGKYPITRLMDAAAPSLALGQAIGRWGNYANMEAYGTRVYARAAQFFPLAVEIPVAGADGTEWQWHMATFFYEFVWDIAVFAVLMAFRKKMRRSGDVAWWYLLLYCAGRTVIEGLREDSLMLTVMGSYIRFSQLLSILVCAGIVALFLARLCGTRRVRLPDVLTIIIAAFAIFLCALSGLERATYPMLFTVSQYVLLILLALDTLLLLYYGSHVRNTGAPVVFMLIAVFSATAVLLLGVNRVGLSNIVYIALRQAVAMEHVAFAGAFVYLRGRPKRKRAEPNYGAEGA